MKSPINLKYPLPKPGDAGYFGAVRRFDIHTGIDLYCDDGDPVYAMESGKIISVEAFTGEHASSPWWENTWAILIEGNSGVIVYGEIIVNPELDIHSCIEEGQLLGYVKSVLKNDKGVTPTSMLHLELMKHGFYQTYWWHIGEDKPDGLCNPITLFDNID